MSTILEPRSVPVAVVSQPPWLPPTIEDRHVGLPLLWPGHGTWVLWLVDGATDFVVDVDQVLGLLELEFSEVCVEFPITWQHIYYSVKHRAQQRVPLWSREIVLELIRRVILTGDGRARVEAASELQRWLNVQHFGLCLADPQRTLDEALPLRHGDRGEEFPVAAAAKRLQVRYGPAVTRELLFQLMQQLGWIERDTSVPERTHWVTTLPGRAREYVCSRPVKIPGGSYEQVFVTQVGLAELAVQVRAEIEPSLPVFEEQSS